MPRLGGITMAESVNSPDSGLFMPREETVAALGGPDSPGPAAA
eukprot:gene10768-347_t